ncbi:hypothetical protein EW145_g5625 [Phellinidium pouzarii]|uniref:DUF218 domain-containing protein n=1 Tax=Phellinidium pouzarii TaxID=167371 RepID=A0A4S4KZD1_9AGAM|nr:hypothetical protein EW145_g5625 [Phellinidium pouzarii]
MLPAPVSSRHRQFRKPSTAGVAPRTVWSYRLHLLSARSRATNLAVLLLTASLALSLIVNIRHWLLGRTLDYDGQLRHSGNPSVLGTGRYGPVKSIEDTMDRSTELQKLDHLVVVVGHGVWLGNDAGEVLDEHSWVLERYPSGGGVQTRIEAFTAHIRKGAELAEADPKSLLVFSGGATQASTPISESVSYFSLAIALSLLVPPSSSSVLRPSSAHLTTYERTATEEYALDSFQNLLFSIARFRTVTNHYPKRMTVVGYAIKEDRFDELHRAALRWPAKNWHYVGIDMEDAQQHKQAIQGERTNGYLPYSYDLYGCHEMLLEKRRARNRHHHAHPYHIAAPEIAPLLEWCPGIDAAADSRGRLAFGPEKSKNVPIGKADSYSQVFDGPLPWDDL